MTRLSSLLVLFALILACGQAPPKASPISNTDDVGDSGMDDIDAPDGDEISEQDTDVEHDTPDPIVTPEPRAAGTRAPRTAPCDPIDPTACLLPWPSDTFTQADEGTATGLRLHVVAEGFYPHDDPSSYARANGHSRISPVVTSFPRTIAAEALGDGVEGGLRVIVSEPGAALGEPVPLRFLAVQDAETSPPTTTIVAYPRVPMRAATEHVALVLDQVQDEGGEALAQESLASVALGLKTATTQDEADLYAYHAPTRAALAAAGIEPERVVRVWSFTTRSVDDPIGDLLAVRDLFLQAVDEGAVGVAVDRVSVPEGGTVAAVVQGRLTGLPHVATEEGLLRDADGRPVANGTRDIPFRVALPRSQADYRIVMYAHGMGGDVSDPAFDGVITSEGAAKVGIQFDDWTGDGIVRVAGTFGATSTGSDRLAAHLIENLAGGMAVQRALAGVLGELLAAPTLEGQPNPLAGLRPDTRRAVWAGGSLGGTTGLVYASVSPDVGAAVLNVPGAGYSHFLRFSELYGALGLLLKAYYPTQADVHLAIAMAQVNLDTADGAIFVEAAPSPATLLLQESIGDPILPNIGTELAAAAVGARQVGAVLRPIWGLEPADEAVGVSAITQYRVDSDESLAIHGFAERAWTPGDAAQEQIRVFISSWWADGTARTVIPTACQDNEPAGSCDFGP